MNWPETVDHCVVCVCWTFIVWRAGAGLFARWKDSW